MKRHFAKEFVFQVGPYPSRGAIDYAIDCQTLMEALPAAERVVVTATLSGKEAARHERALPKDGKLTGTLSVGKMGDGAVCEIVAAISDRSGKALSTKRESFVRKVMPFEKTPPAGIEDIVPAPFTSPVVEGNSISCVGRTYTHGTSGLLEGIHAGGKEILAAPVTLRIESPQDAGGNGLRAASGGPFSLKSVGHGKAVYQQVFTVGGAEMAVSGDFDYDGFYRFSVHLAPMVRSAAGSVAVNRGCLEVPLRDSCATLIEAPVEWMWKDWQKCTGFLNSAQGRLWDSKRFPFAVHQHKGNMPPFCWVGDDERGMCFSCTVGRGNAQ